MKKDITKKQLEDYNDVYADIFNALLFGGERILQEEYLVPLPTETFTRNKDGSLRQGNRDIRKADKRNGSYRLICGEENQESRENTMPQRVMGYDYAAYEEQIKALVDKNKAEGKSAFVKLKPFVSDYSMNLIEMARLPEEARKRLRSDFRLIAEYAACKKQVLKLEELIADQNYVIRHPEEFLDALSAVAGDKRYERIKKQVQKRAETKKEDITMCLIAEELENRGIKKGRQEGIKKGLQKGIRKGLRKGRQEGAKSKAEAVARNMFVKGMSAEDTAAICEESLGQIEAWFDLWSKE